MEFNYHKLNLDDDAIIRYALEGYLKTLKKEKENISSNRIKREIEKELNLVYQTIINFNNSLNKEEEE